ncbi:MAG TPA: RNA polymerase factor sigma-54 [Desulfobacteria bacterium]|nr:RNA polymerase factor sigma-54 [Desulfobacteria bacterium]
MRLDFSQQLGQIQKLIITPELRQAINILQMPALELSQFVNEQLLENPLLEAKEERDDEPAETGQEEQAVDWQEYFLDRSDLGLTRERRQDEFSSENFLTSLPTLQDHLMEQLDITVTSKRELLIGKYLIGNIDDNGYLAISVAETAQATGVSPAEAEQVLSLIQTFDPPGVGARDLKECLLLQLAQHPDAPKAAEILVKEHLAELGAGKISKIAAALRLSTKDVQETADFIRTLDPKPGRRFASGQDVRFIVPDVVVEKVNGDYVVLVNDNSYPRLGINRGYREALSGKVDDAAKQFVETKLQAAASLIRSIEQRRLTIYRVVSCIVDLQREFFDKGPRYLKTMTLRQVAEVVNLHESTVSRATANKYMQNPHGVFPLRYFFASGVENETGETTSAESVKRMLKDLISAEDQRKPLSDQKITDLLIDRGINISRRTVAKYRDELGIPSTTLRKRY